MDFSVLIPAYNVSGIIGRAIRSAAAQTLPPLEILVINDCSTDNTVQVVKALARDIPSIRLLSTPANGGPSAARNIGLGGGARRLDRFARCRRRLEAGPA